MTTTACGGHLNFWKVDQQQVTVETHVVRGSASSPRNSEVLAGAPLDRC
ncbi:MAG: hypothetical protein NTY19_27125 [Planctomycetota bacterium]|nr:hypothetical protein [Planctomycetota bacterium]